MYRSAMTFIELVVVVVIIGVLSSVLGVAAISVLNYAGKAHCQSNLRQVGMCFFMYAGEHGNKFPAEGNNGIKDPAFSPAWFYRLVKYAERMDVDDDNSIFQCSEYDYVKEGVFDEASPKSFKMNAYLDRGNKRFFYRLGMCRDEGLIPLMLDAHAGETGMGQWGHCYPSAINDERHNGEANVLFIDGHVEAVGLEGDETWKTKFRWVSAAWSKKE